MHKVTLIVETDGQYTGQYTKVTRPGDDLGVLLAQCIYAVAETSNSSALKEIAQATKSAIEQRRHTR